MPMGAPDKEEPADGIEGCGREFEKCRWRWSEWAEREDTAWTRSVMVWGPRGPPAGSSSSVGLAPAAQSGQTLCAALDVEAPRHHSRAQGV